MRNLADESLPPGGPHDEDRRRSASVDLFAWQVVDDAVEVDGEATVIDPDAPTEKDQLPARIPDRQDDVIVAALPVRRIQVYPGEVAEVDVVLVNNGRTPATFLVHVEGWFDESWLAPLPPVMLQAGERSTVVLEIAPPRRPETEAGEYAIVVVVRSHDYPSHTARLGAQLNILPYDEIAVEVLPATQPALSWFRRSTLLPVAIANRGNRSAAVRMQAGDAQQRCSYEFYAPGAPAGTALLTVRPGQTITTPLRVVAQHLPLIGLQGRHMPFYVTATAAQAPEAAHRARGAVALHPLVGPWQMASVTGVGILAALGVLMLTVVAFLVLRNGGGQTIVQAPASQPPQVIIVNLSQPVAAPALPAAATASTAAAPAAGNAASPNPGLPLVLPDQVSAPDGVASPAIAPAQPLPVVAADSAEGATLTYAQMFQDVAQRFDIDWRMLAAQAYIESSFDSLALSSAGAMGLMQILPGTWREWSPQVGAGDPFDSYDNVLVAAAYLDHLRTLLAGKGYNGREWMLVAYNWGPDKLNDFLAGGGTWESLPEARRQYAEEILRIAQSIP